METKKAGEHTQEKMSTSILKCKLTVSDYGNKAQDNLRIRISAEGEKGFTPIADVLEIYNGSEISETTREIADILKAAPKMLKVLETLAKIMEGKREQLGSYNTTFGTIHYDEIVDAIKSAKGE